jgi:choloylglycine hydrolase
MPLRVPGSDNIATIHLALADASGDSAVIEIVDGGKMSIHHDRAYTVMTNSPPFAQQLANLKQYQGFGGTAPLPGTTEAADRFVRAAYYVQNLLKPQDIRQTVAEILSVMRNVAQPFGRPSPAHPEVSHTIWRTVADATDHVYFFESTLSPNIVWVRLEGLDFGPGAPVRKLDLVHGGDLVGDVTAAFSPSAPLVFLAP